MQLARQMLACTKCKAEKPTADFAPRPTARGFTSHCRACRNAARRKWRTHSVLIVGGPFSASNRTGTMCVAKKLFNIGGSLLYHSKEAILDEIKKCELVCAICHRVRTHNRKLAARRGSKN